jgi:hypothetical protein
MRQATHQAELPGQPTAKCCRYQPTACKERGTRWGRVHARKRTSDARRRETRRLTRVGLIDWDWQRGEIPTSPSFLACERQRDRAGLAGSQSDSAPPGPLTTESHSGQPTRTAAPSAPCRHADMQNAPRQPLLGGGGLQLRIKPPSPVVRYTKALPRWNSEAPRSSIPRARLLRGCCAVAGAVRCCRKTVGRQSAVRGRCLMTWGVEESVLLRPIPGRQMGSTRQKVAYYFCFACSRPIGVTPRIIASEWLSVAVLEEGSGQRPELGLWR